MPQLLYHFEVIRHAFFETFGFERLADILQEPNLLTEIDVYLPDGCTDTLLRCNEQIRRIDVQRILLVVFMPVDRVKRCDTFNLVPPKLDTVSQSVVAFDGRENIDRIAVHAKTAARKLHFIIHIKRIDKQAKHLVAGNPHPFLQIDDLLFKSTWIGHAVKTRDGRDDDHIATSGEQRGRSTQT